MSFPEEMRERRRTVADEAPTHDPTRENAERVGITVEARADRLTYAVADVLNECPGEMTLALLERPMNVGALAERYTEVREHYDAEEGERARRHAVAELRGALEEIGRGRG